MNWKGAKLGREYLKGIFERRDKKVDVLGLAVMLSSLETESLTAIADSRRQNISLQQHHTLPRALILALLQRLDATLDP